MTTETAEDQPIDASNLLKGAGWRQGSVFELAELRPLLPDDVRPEVTIGVILSQDCDIVLSSNTEPTIEIILGKLVPASSPDWLYGKNPRKLHLKLADNSILELDVQERYVLKKEEFCLAQIANPSEELSLDHKRNIVLTQWIAKRYTRPAFPDAFNERLRAISKQIKKLTKSTLGEAVDDIYLALEPADTELEDGEPYEVSVTVVYRDVSREDDAKDFCSKLKELLIKCEDLDIIGDECEAKYYDKVSLLDLEGLRRWDFDYRTIEGDLSTSDDED